MPTIHLLEGPVGAGKSTFAIKLSERHRAPRLTLDEWMVTLFRPDRPDTDFLGWYTSRKARCIEQIWQVALEILASGSDVILELGLVQAAARKAFYERIDAANCDLVLYLLDASRSERAQRVQDRNRQQGATFQMAVSDAMFELADSAWEAPDALELEARDVRTIASQ